MIAAATRTEVLTPSEIMTAENFLRGTRDNLLHAVGDLSERQARHKLSDECWSVREIVEHIVLVESRAHRVLDRMQHAELDSRECPKDADAFITTEVPIRRKRLSAPEIVMPSQGWALPHGVEQFQRAREQTMELVRCAPCLRGRVIHHPMFGPWDGYQWILGAAAHSARHTEQIWELRSNPEFPLD